MGAFLSYGSEMVLTGTGYPERVNGARVSTGFFRVVLLSNEFWRTRFAADSGIVGTSVTFDDNSYTVVGVLAAGQPWLAPR